MYDILNSSRKYRWRHRYNRWFRFVVLLQVQEMETEMREKSEARHPYPRYTDESVPFPILFKEYLLLTKLLMKMEVSNIVIMVIPLYNPHFQSRNQSKNAVLASSNAFQKYFWCNTNGIWNFSLKNSVFRRNRKSYRYCTFKNRAWDIPRFIVKPRFTG